VTSEDSRVDVQIEILKMCRLEISSSNLTSIHFHHNTGLIARALGGAESNHIKLALEAKLFESQTKLPSDIHEGAFALSYLSSDLLTPRRKNQKTFRFKPEN
jgi:hypothetical protein